MSIIKKLTNYRVVRFEKHKNIIQVTEECDDYYTVGLTKAETLQLAQELIDLANTIED